ncbi:MAG: DUF5606 domain-containing protein [Chitinophagales bacterium]
MSLRDVLAISNKPGLYKIVANRDNGLIASPLGQEKNSFFPSRLHMFTPLENITIYTDSDTVELAEVLKSMKAEEKSMESLKSNDDFRKFFIKVVPNHDQEKVYTSDIKKIVKWYKSLKEFGYLNEDASNESDSKADTLDSKKKVAKKATKKAAKPKMAKPKAPVKKIEKRGSQRGN